MVCVPSQVSAAPLTVFESAASNRCVVSVTTAPLRPVNTAVVQLRTFDSKKKKKASFDRMFEAFTVELSGTARSSLIGAAGAYRLLSAPTSHAWMFIVCDSRSCIRFWRQPATRSLVFAFVLKGKKCTQPYFIIGKVAFCCSWPHLVRARNENHLLRISGEEATAPPPQNVIDIRVRQRRDEHPRLSAGVRS